MSAFELLFDKILHPKTKKPLKARIATNEWIVQVVVENKLWFTVYHSMPPNGVPEFIAKSVEEAQARVLMEAYEGSRAWVESNPQDTDTQ